LTKPIEKTMGEGMEHDMIDREMLNDVFRALQNRSAKNAIRDSYIFTRHAVNGETFKEIGTRYGISTPRAREIFLRCCWFARTVLMEKYSYVRNIECTT